MPYVIGTDEAGYGPNLGPLVVTATVWEIDEGIDGAELYKHLRRCVSKSTARPGKKRIVWDDSKAIYKGGDGIGELERGVLAALGLLDRTPSDWTGLWQVLDAQCAATLGEAPWHRDYSTPVPMWLESDGIGELTDCVRKGLISSGVRLVAVLSRAVFADRFNETVASCANKADALSRITLSLVADALALIEFGRVQVFCDKHGGRNRYAPLLQSQFPDDWLEVRHESADESSYRFGPENRRIEIGFWVKGERFLPTALASMVSKYLRETAMKPFNKFWCDHIPGLAPTAGYPVDSYRFKKQIANKQHELEIADAILWRER
jgi:hypothetical protein